VIGRPAAIEWDEHNEIHATRHKVSALEIEQVLRNSPVHRRNKRQRSGDYIAIGYTDGGRHVAVVISWKAERQCVRPITAWEV
jgi:uncharacterized DUF497 family protein